MPMLRSLVQLLIGMLVCVSCNNPQNAQTQSNPCLANRAMSVNQSELDILNEIINSPAPLTVAQIRTYLCIAFSLRGRSPGHYLFTGQRKWMTAIDKLLYLRKMNPFEKEEYKSLGLWFQFKGNTFLESVLTNHGVWLDKNDPHVIYSGEIPNSMVPVLVGEITAWYENKLLSK